MSSENKFEVNLLPGSSADVYKQIILSIRPIVYRFICENEDQTVVQALVIATSAVLDVGNLVSQNCLNPSEKIVKLFTHILSLVVWPNQRDPLRVFLEVLINFNLNGSSTVSNGIQHHIRQEFANQVQIVSPRNAVESVAALSNTTEVYFPEVVSVQSVQDLPRQHTVVAINPDSLETQSAEVIEHLGESQSLFRQENHSLDHANPQRNCKNGNRKYLIYIIRISFIMILAVGVFILTLTVLAKAEGKIDSGFVHTAVTENGTTTLSVRPSGETHFLLTTTEKDNFLSSNESAADPTNTENATPSKAFPLQIITNPTIPAEPTISPSPLPSKKRLKYTITVNSYVDFQNQLRSAPPNRDIIVKIFIWDPTEWQNEQTLTRATDIYKLYIGGNIKIEKITHFLNQTTAVKEVVLSNGLGKLCAWNPPQHGISYTNSRINLASIRLLRFNYFTSGCEEFFSAWAATVETPNLVGIALKKSFLDYRNSVWLKRIFKNNWKTLKYLKFQNTRLATVEFIFDDEISRVLQHVEEFHLDNPSDFVNTKFCNTFPNLRLLVSDKGHVVFDQLHSLSKCKYLSKMILSVNLQSTTTFDLSVFSTGFHSLQKLNISLTDEMCENPGISEENRQVYLNGLSRLPNSILEVGIQSKCKILQHPGDTYDHSFRDANHGRRARYNFFDLSIRNAITD